MHGRDERVDRIAQIPRRRSCVAHPFFSKIRGVSKTHEPLVSGFVGTEADGGNFGCFKQNSTPAPHRFQERSNATPDE
jgi:hypothetical protein